MSKVIGVIGTRKRDSEEDFIIVEKEFLKHYLPGDTICSGLCPQGGDRFAVLLQEKYNLPYIWHPAKWSIYGLAAGHIRNTDIVRDSDILIACVSKERRGGTEDSIMKFLKSKGMTNLILLEDKK